MSKQSLMGLYYLVGLLVILCKRDISGDGRCLFKFACTGGFCAYRVRKHNVGEVCIQGCVYNSFVRTFIY